MAKTKKKMLSSPANHRRALANAGNALVRARKVQNLIRHCQISPDKALKLWNETRKRMPRPVAKSALTPT